MPKNQKRTIVLSASDSALVVAQLAEATHSDLPLSQSLQVIAEEFPRGKPKRVLAAMVERLVAGRTMTEILADPSMGLSNEVRALLAAAFRSTEPRTVLADVREFLLETAQRRLRFWQTMAYPCVLFVFAAAFLMFTVFYVVPGISVSMVEDFGIELPAATKFLMWFADWGIWILLGGVVVALVVVATVAAAGGRRWLHRLRRVVPFVGPTMRYDAQTGVLRVLAMLLRHQVPLGEALRLTAETSRDQSLRYSCNIAARRVDAGKPLSKAMEDTNCFPGQIMRMIEWGESRSQLKESLRTASDLCSQYAQLYSQWLRVAVPAATFLFVVWIANVMMASTFAPLISLINALSG